MSLNIVRKGPEAAAGSKSSLLSIRGAATPIKEVARVAETIAIKTASDNLKT
jgi:hypothetical protein